jgi:glycosyltransferase involved in cell wall biosynthesis
VDALTRLLRDEALRQRLRRAGRVTIEQNYHFGARMQKIQAIYNELLGSGDPRPQLRDTPPS